MSLKGTWRREHNLSTYHDLITIGEFVENKYEVDGASHAMRPNALSIHRGQGSLMPIEWRGVWYGPTTDITSLESVDLCQRLPSGAFTLQTIKLALKKGGNSLSVSFKLPSGENVWDIQTYVRE